jgi:anti-sigma B factor antagonist
MADPSCNVTIDQTAGPCRAVIAGEFDLAATDPVRTAIRPPLASALVVDLAAITFIDAAGMSCLLALRAEANEHGGSFTVGHVSAVVKRLFKLTGLDRELHIGD